MSGTLYIDYGLTVRHLYSHNNKLKKGQSNAAARIRSKSKFYCVKNWLNSIEAENTSFSTATVSKPTSIVSPCTRHDDTFSSFTILSQFGEDHGHEDDGYQAYISTGAIFAQLQQCIEEVDFIAGRQIYWRIIDLGLESSAFLGSHLIRMFANFECLSGANQVFLRIPDPSLYTWDAIISAHVKLGKSADALHFYHEMRNSSLIPDAHVFVSVLKACSNLTDLYQGILIHSQIVECGLETHDFVSSSLVDFYSRCNRSNDALLVFYRIPVWTATSCSLMIAGFIDQGREDIALALFMEILEGGAYVDAVTYITALKTCSNIACLDWGRKIHAFIVESGLELDIRVGNALINMYVKCESLSEAINIFYKVPDPDVIAWTVLMSGYAEQGFGQEALRLFESMQYNGINPTPITLVLVLKACSNAMDLDQGRKTHALLVESGAELNNFAGSGLIDMYGKCDSLEDAKIVFRRLQIMDVITWSALIGRTADNGHTQEAFQLYEQMQHDGLIPDIVTFICILKACSGDNYLEHGRQIHRQIVESGLEMDTFLGNALVDMYVKCRSLEDALLLSNRLREPNIVTWSVLIGGYVEHGFALEATQVFDYMHKAGVQLDKVSFVCSLKACSTIAALEQGRHIHSMIIAEGYESDSFVSSTLIDMYGKCGSLKDGERTFERISDYSVVSWSTLMSGYAQEGDYMSVLKCFENMQSSGLLPDDVSFLSLLAACSQRGLAEKGCVHFKSMRDEFCIVPTLRHYNAVVEILGQAGKLDEAEDLLETIPFQSNVIGWTSLLTSCRSHSNVTVGRRSFDKFIILDRGNAIGYVLMGNLYSQIGMRDKVEEIEELRKYANGWKKPGKAFIEIDNCVHDFNVGDRTHPQSNAIYAKLEDLNSQITQAGYKPRTDLVLDTMTEDEKEHALCGHCEKLAIAFGLISTAEGSTIRVSKNLRMCADCHNVTKMISKIEMREIIVVDTYCTHHFEDGVCSCGENV